jgi:hypothetical protein
MKTQHLIIPVLMALSACTGSPTTQNTENDTTSVLLSTDSISYAEQRSAITRELEALVDRYDETINQLQQNESGTSTELMSKLKVAKDRVERDLQEVNQTALNGWDINYVERIKVSIEKNKNELSTLKAELP